MTNLYILNREWGQYDHGKQWTSTKITFTKLGIQLLIPDDFQNNPQMFDMLIFTP